MGHLMVGGRSQNGGGREQRIDAPVPGIHPAYALGLPRRGAVRIRGYARRYPVFSSRRWDRAAPTGAVWRRRGDRERPRLMRLGIRFLKKPPGISTPLRGDHPHQALRRVVAAPYHNLMAPLLDILHSGDHQALTDFDTLMACYRQRLTKAVQEGLEHQNLQMYNRTVRPASPRILLCRRLPGTRAGSGRRRRALPYAYMAPSFVGIANLGWMRWLRIPGIWCLRSSGLPLPNFPRHYANNYVGYEPLRAYIMNRLPRYGNDNAEADSLAQKITAFLPKLYARCAPITA